MKKLVLLLSGLALGIASQAQVVLSGTSYTQNFDALATGLPTGWSVRTGATAAVLGTDVSPAFTATSTGTALQWNSTAGGFKNMASADGFANFAAGTAAAQDAATDRVLAVRQITATDMGVAFVMQIANTTGRTGFNIAFKLQSLDLGSPRKATWKVDYGVGATPATFDTVATTPAPLSTGDSTFSNTNVTASFGSALNNQSGPVWVRIVVLNATTGGGNRPSTGIDDISLTWTGTGAPNYRPQVTALAPGNNGLNVTPGTTNLTMTFNRNITKQTGNITLRNETDQTSASIALANVTVSGTTATLSGVTLAAGKTYHVRVDSTVFDTAGFRYLGIYDSLTWRFSTAPPVVTVNSLNQNFDSACTAGGLPSGWTKYSVTGAQEWNCDNGTGTNRYMTMNGFASSANVANEDWLITPRLNVSAMLNPQLFFRSRYRFGGPVMQVMVSSNYTGTGNPNATGITWTDLNITYASADSNAWAQKTASLTSYKTNPFFIAFKYLSNDGASGNGRQWDVDSVFAVESTGTGIANVAKGTLAVSVLGKASNNNLTVAFAATKAEAYTITVFDLAGREVARKEVVATAGTNRVTLVPGSLYSGLYIVRVSNANSYGVTRAFVE